MNQAKLRRLTAVALSGILAASHLAVYPITSYADTSDVLELPGGLEELSEFGLELNDSQVDLQYTDDYFSIQIPKKIYLSGNKTDTSSEYKITVAGYLADTESVQIVPEDSFTLSSVGKDDITVTVVQDDCSWSSEDAGLLSGVTKGGTLTYPDLSAGEWTGSLTFTISASGFDSYADLLSQVMCLSEERDSLIDEIKVASEEQDELLDSLSELSEQNASIIIEDPDDILVDGEVLDDDELDELTSLLNEAGLSVTEYTEDAEDNDASAKSAEEEDADNNSGEGTDSTDEDGNTENSDVVYEMVVPLAALAVDDTSSEATTLEPVLHEVHEVQEELEEQELSVIPDEELSVLHDEELRVLHEEAVSVELEDEPEQEPEQESFFDPELERELEALIATPSEAQRADVTDSLDTSDNQQESSTHSAESRVGRLLVEFTSDAEAGADYSTYSYRQLQREIKRLQKANQELQEILESIESANERLSERLDRVEELLNEKLEAARQAAIAKEEAAEALRQAQEKAQAQAQLEAQAQAGKPSQEISTETEKITSDADEPAEEIDESAANKEQPVVSEGTEATDSIEPVQGAEESNSEDATISDSSSSSSDDEGSETADDEYDTEDGDKPSNGETNGCDDAAENPDSSVESERDDSNDSIGNTSESQLEDLGTESNEVMNQELTEVGFVNNEGCLDGLSVETTSGDEAVNSNDSESVDEEKTDSPDEEEDEPLSESE